MKVLLTGASGFVGSHVLDRLISRGISTRLLLRAGSSKRFLETHRNNLEIVLGSISDRATLPMALEGVTHIAHLAGSTKSLDDAGFFRVNQEGTRNLVQAVNHSEQALRFIHVSSLAAAGPATSDAPSKETNPPAPVSVYGKSKLAGEKEVIQGCKKPFVIIRPPGVYGPRDAEFLKLFKAVKNHLLPTFGGGRQELSLVYVEDLAAAIVECLNHKNAVGQVFNIAHPEVLTSRQLAEEIARTVRTWTVPLPLPQCLFWPICAGQELVSQLTRKPNVLSRQKYPELVAPGWVCDTSQMREETGFVAGTNLRTGLELTLSWYRREGWL